MAPSPDPSAKSQGSLDYSNASGRQRNFFDLVGRAQQAASNCIHHSFNDARHSTRRGGPNNYSGLNSFDDYTFDDAGSYNNFPTRETDLRHVDQSINLMDAETANYRNPPRSNYVFARDEDSNDGSDDDVYKNYTRGYRSGKKHLRPGSIELKLIEDGLHALRKGETIPRRFSDPNLFDHHDDEESVAIAPRRKRQPKHHSMSFLTDLDDCSERRKSLEDGSDSSDDSEWADILLDNQRHKVLCRRLKQLGLVLLLLVGTATLAIVFWEDAPLVHRVTERGGDGDAGLEDAILPNTVEHQHPEELPSTTPGDIARRQMVLKHVLEHGLLHQNHDHAKELDLDRVPGQAALTWMTATDVTSMKMLDHYVFYHHSHTLHPEPIVSGKHYTPSNKEEMDQDIKILDRFIYVAFYFVSHPDCNPKSKACKVH